MKAFIFSVVLFFLVISTQATTHYFISGNAQTPGNWNTLTTGGGLLRLTLPLREIYL